jgi:Lectin C-type domain
LKKNLVSLASQEKNACFQRMLAEKGFSDDGVWIGLNKIGESNYSKWENGADLTNTDWHAKKPSSFASAHCVKA